MAMDEAVRAYRWKQQGLDGSMLGDSAYYTIFRTGWIRSVGGCTPYLSLHARTGQSREQIDAELAKLKLHELPSLRGCTYVIGKEDFGFALLCSRGHGDDAEIEMAKKHLGVTERELERLGEKLVAAVATQALEPREIKDALGDAVRSLGPAGKKRGVSTTLPLVLGRLQVNGTIRRIPVDGRLDSQRYKYGLWKVKPTWRYPDDQRDASLVARYFHQFGPALTKEFAWWAGVSIKDAKEAMKEIPLGPFDDHEGRGRWVGLYELGEVWGSTIPKKPVIKLLPALDNLWHPRREVWSLMDSDDIKLKLFDGKDAIARAGSVVELPHHGIVDRGRLIGFWEYDKPAEQIVWGVFPSQDAKVKKAVKDEVARMQEFIRDQLGDARMFSLDTPESRAPRIAAVKKLATK